MMWQTKKLGEICDIQLGKTPSRSDLSLWDDKKNSKNIWLSIADLPFTTKAVLNNSKEYISDKGALLCKKVPKDTLVLSFKLSIGRLAFTGTELYTNEAIAALYIKNESLIDREYLYWYLTFFDWDSAVGSDTKVKGKTLNKEKLKLIDVLLPCIDEQKQIVAILDEAFANIDHARQLAKRNLKNARELFDSTLNLIFAKLEKDQDRVALGEIATVKTGGTPSKSKSEYWHGNIPWYSSGELNFRFTNEPKEMITGIGLSSSNAKVFPKGSLLIGMYDTAALKMSLLDRDAAFNQAIAGVEPNEKVNLNFVRFYIDYQKESILSQRRGVRQKNLNQSKIKNISLFLPGIATQDEVVDMIVNLEHAKSQLILIYQQKITALDELKQSLLQKAFRGELIQVKSAA